MYVAYTQRDCWHCHHVANTRLRLWNRVAHWLDGVLERFSAP